MKLQVLLTCLTVFAVGSTAAQDDASGLPVSLNADYIELNFNTQERLYRGNVVLSQGSTVIKCDEMTTIHNNQDELLTVHCSGRPSIFKIQSAKTDHDSLVGTAKTITYDRQKNQITLLEEAEMRKRETTISGHLISYDLGTGKTIVQYNRENPSTESATSSDSNIQSSSRAKIVIRSRKDSGS